MSKNEQLTKLLTDKSFTYNGKDYVFSGCKSVSNKIMILTDKETIQVTEFKFDDFYDEILSTVGPVNRDDKVLAKYDSNQVHHGVIIPESSGIFKKVSDSFDKLLMEIESADEAKLQSLELKSKMLTSVAQSAISMQNSQIEMIKVINK